VAGCSEHSFEPQGSIKDGEFVDQLRDHQLLKKASAYRISTISSTNMVAMPNCEVGVIYFIHDEFGGKVNSRGITVEGSENSCQTRLS
jgi:hypothetical protein